MGALTRASPRRVMVKSGRKRKRNECQPMTSKDDNQTTADLESATPKKVKTGSFSTKISSLPWKKLEGSIDLGELGEFSEFGGYTGIEVVDGKSFAEVFTCLDTRNS